ncbi:MAG: hypothetical protein M0Q51_14485 [Bacteroidales bacterium]|nr:hypothetical protein [Bacteroidales bacterium]
MDMKFWILIGFCFIGFLSTNCQEPDNRIIVKPGIGIDNISFLESDSVDIKNYLGVSIPKILPIKIDKKD